MYILGFVIFISVWLTCMCNNDFCYADSTSCKYEHRRYLLYDVNPPEGFNLRRDVYMRFAILAHNLKKSRNDDINSFHLVLPPWSRLYHWKYSETPEHIPWSRFFDLDSLKKFAPVIEMWEFFQYPSFKNQIVLDQVYILQHFSDMFESGNFEDRFAIEQCTKKYNLNYFYYSNMTSDNVQCLSWHGSATKLDLVLLNTTAKSILVHHAEVALHEMFGDKVYWQARRSMRFNKHLKQIADIYRRQYLDSNDDDDNTNLPDNWLEETQKRNAKGGPYLGVHIRRKDFLYGRADQVPSLDSIVEQIDEKMKELGLSKVFIATDASYEEYEKIHDKLTPSYKVHRFEPTVEILHEYGDGGVAIIDQIICSHSRHFIGTQESTFSFRIQEEREILGFPIKSTFNSFCNTKNKCPQPSIWKIIY